MGIDHGCAHIFVAQQLLNGAYVIAIFQQVRCEAVTESVAATRLTNPGAAQACLDCFLQHPLADMVTMNGS
jgi:hypothetical protein